MPSFDASSPLGPDGARRLIGIYGAELSALAAIAASQYGNLDPPGAVICEPGTTEGESLSAQLDPKLPIRVVEDGSTIAVLPRDALLKLVRGLAPQCENYLEDPQFGGPGRLPILVVGKTGSMMGSVDYQPDL